MTNANCVHGSVSFPVLRNLGPAAALDFQFYFKFKCTLQLFLQNNNTRS